MAPDSTLEELNARLAALLRELDAGTIDLVSAFAEYLNDDCPSASEGAIHRASRSAIERLKRGSLRALERNIRTLATDSFAIARRAACDPIEQWEPDVGASAAGARGTLTRALGILDEHSHRSRRVGNDLHPGGRGRGVRPGPARLSPEELDARWREYQELLRQTGECLQAIDAHLRDRLMRQALGPSI